MAHTPMHKNPNIGGNIGNIIYGTLGGGSTQSINPHGMTTSMLNWLSNYQQMKQNIPQAQQTLPNTLLNFPNALSFGRDIYKTYSGERLRGRAVDRNFRMTGQGIADAEEDLRKRRILMNENLASRGLMGKMREGRPATMWRTEGAQANINLARTRQFEEKKRWKRGRLHRILFGG